MNKRRVVNRLANSEGGYVYYHEICEEMKEQGIKKEEYKCTLAAACVNRKMLSHCVANIAYEA